MRFKKPSVVGSLGKDQRFTCRAKFFMSSQPVYDVIIAGGAVTGSSVACHLAQNPDFKGRVLVIEKDMSYQKCATALSAGSIRQQFSSAINIAISLYGIEFLRSIGETLSINGTRPDISLHEGGYLFLATRNGQKILAENHELQARMGADIAYMDAYGLKNTFDWLNTENIVSGCYGRTGEGWFDGYGLMQAFRGKARSLGVDYKHARITGVKRTGGRIEAVVLDNGETIACGALVNAAGTGAAMLAREAGLELPVHSRKRMVFTFDCADKLETFPLMIDPTGVYVRPEGQGFLCGSAPPADSDPDCEDFEIQHQFFDDVIWPTLAHRVPAFERIKQRASWAGHYDMNLFDHNAIIGLTPGLDNFYLANGFSGHGLQQSPAIGRGLSELITYGAYRSLDLSDLGFERILRNEPLLERNVV